MVKQHMTWLVLGWESSRIVDNNFLLITNFVLRLLILLAGLLFWKNMGKQV